MLLWFTIAQTARLAPFALATGGNVLLPSVVILLLPVLEEPTLWQERLYQEALFGQVL